MSIWKGIWKDIPGAAMAIFTGLVIGAVLSTPIWLIAFLVPAPEKSPARQCAKQHEEGSSAWVRCVDRLVEEKEAANG